MAEGVLDLLDEGRSPHMHIRAVCRFCFRVIGGEKFALFGQLLIRLFTNIRTPHTPGPPPPTTAPAP